MTIKVAVVTKYLLEREGLVRLLERRPQFDVIAAASSAVELAAVIDGHKPDIVVVVVGPPGTGAADGSGELPGFDTDTALVVLAQGPDGRLAAGLLAHRRAGRGYLIHQRQDRQELFEAITAVASGQTMLDPEVIDALIADLYRGDQAGSRHFSPRELEVLAAIADGLSNASIARSLQITKRTVERHVSAVYRKLNIRERDDVDRRVAAALLYLKDATSA